LNDLNYSKEELKEIIGSIGDNSQINKSTQFFNADKIHIGNHVRIDAFCILIGPITLGNYIHISPYTAFLGGYGIEFNDFSGTAAGVIIYSGTDDYTEGHLMSPTVPDAFRKVSGGKVTFKKHSIAAARVTILPGVTLGVGAVAGACSLVNKNVEDFTVVAGIPAKFIKTRNSKRFLEFEKKLMKEIEDGRW